MKKRSELVTIWECASNTPGWLRVLWLTKLYTDEELDEMEQIDDEFRDFAREEEIKHRKWLRENLPRTTDGWLKIFPEAKHLVKPVSQQQKKFDEQLEVARSVDLESVV